MRNNIFGITKLRVSSEKKLAVKLGMLNIFRIVAIISFILVVLGKRTSLEWAKCGSFLCTTIFVPLNHHDSNSSLIPIALKKYPARLQPPKMTILVNPGGPGASAEHMLSSKGHRFVKIFGDQVDIVGFDPRGVGQSFKVNCVSPKQAAGISESFRYFQIPFLPKSARQAQIKYFETGWKANAEICSSKAGDSLAYFSTAYTARDMEIIRKALNMERMNFLGLSYGGTVAVTYANLFPDKVGRMILSSAPNPEHYFSDTVS
jgi:pimeloyl-ACP methyl ester carboxylesterase